MAAPALTLDRGETAACRQERALDRGEVVLGVGVGEAEGGVGVGLAEDVGHAPGVPQDTHGVAPGRGLPAVEVRPLGGAAAAHDGQGSEGGEEGQESGHSVALTMDLGHGGRSLLQAGRAPRRAGAAATRQVAAGI